MRSILASFLALGLIGCTKDLDGDGYNADEDCNDDNDAIHPGANETCDGVDNNCNGKVDEGVEELFYADADNDSYGDPESSTPACSAPEGYVSNDDDCNDLSADFYPGAPEADCTDSNDYNCDGSVGFADADGDGWAACEDCDDSDAARSPSATEVCDDIDNNCNGVVDIDATETPDWYLDYDGDGYGDATVTVSQCDPPERFVDNALDCDDSAAEALPGGVEVCDNLDNDCDGTVDGQDAEGAAPFYTDVDGDGYGTDSTEVFICFPDANQVPDAGDCDDDNDAISPGEVEVCNDGIDNDCDGTSEGCEIEAEELSDIVLSGAAAEDYAGRAITGIGDINNDGFDDMLVGADGYADEGAAYVILGPLSAGTSDTLDNVAFLTIEGSSSAGSAGERGLGLGDIDGDGLDDFLVAAPTATDRAARSGTVHLFLGSTIAAQTSGGTFSVDNSDFQWNGNDGYDWAGEGLAHLGDWNGDGHDDFAIGATGDEANGAGSGTVYVIPGTGSAPSGTATSVVTAGTLAVSGDAGWFVGANIDGLGDFDGDGNDDLGIGVIQADANGSLSGGAFVVSGGQTGNLSIEDADLRLNGTNANDRAGAGLGAAGDIDDDGYPDMFVGVSRDDSAGADAGAIILIYGRADLSTIDGSNIQAVADATVTGPSAGIGLGESFVGNFDFDGDGELDLLAGAPRDGLNQEGAGYLMLGPISGTRSFATDTYASFVGDGPSDGIGSEVSIPGDVLGTGAVVLGVGGWADDSNGSDAGSVFLISEIGL
jgi:hypothetical protein